MKSDFIDKIFKVTLLLGSISCLLTIFFDFFFAIGLLLGALWGSINLYFLKLVISKWASKNYGKFTFLSLLKWPLLYFSGFQLLKLKFLSPISLLLGFSLVLLSICFVGIKQLRLTV